MRRGKHGDRLTVSCPGLLRWAIAGCQCSSPVIRLVEPLYLGSSLSANHLWATRSNAGD